MRVAAGLYIQICAIASGAGQFYTRRYSSSGTWTQWQQLPLNFSGAAFHNCIYRGKNLGTEVTADQYSSISSGSFYDMYIGDYWTINGVSYRIAGFNYFSKSGSTALNTNHLLMFPESSLLNSTKMNSTSTTAGGYKDTELRSTYLPQCLATVESAFGASHILEHYEYISNAVTDGVASGAEWVQTKIEIPTETMIAGTIVNGKAENANMNIGNLWQQMPLAVFAPDIARNRISYWLRDVASETHFSYVYSQGFLSKNTAAVTTIGVRPFFLLCGD